MKLYCCGCGCDVEARLTNGAEIYPHRADLICLPFWKCDTCGNFVGCHHKTKNRTAPLGCIPTPELKEARKQLHALIDPIWQSGKMGRRELYEAISREVGWNYHTAKTRTIEEAMAAYKVAQKYAQPHVKLLARQLCTICEQPTGRCEEDEIVNALGQPICEECSNAALRGGEGVRVEGTVRGENLRKD